MDGLSNSDVALLQDRDGFGGRKHGILLDLCTSPSR